MALNNGQYGAIMREYDRRQIATQRKREACTREVYDRIPQMKEAEGEIARLSLRLARAALGKNAQERERLSDELMQLRKKRTSLLLAYGYPADYMEPHFTCTLCEDTGYVRGQECDCFRRLRAALYLEESHLKTILEKENFSRYTERYYDDKRELPVYHETVREHMRGIYQQCRAYAGEFEEKKESLLLTGPAGTGKTFFTHGIAAELLGRGYGVLYLTAPALTEIFSSRMDSREREKRAEEYKRLYECDLLILDDLGTEWNNSLTNSELFACLNERLRGEKPCVISTNLSLKGLSERYSERILSRVIGHYRILELVGEDIRIRKNLEGRGRQSTAPDSI